MKDSLKGNIEYYAKGAVNISIKTIQGDYENEQTVNARIDICGSCPLFDGLRCSSGHFGHMSSDEIYDLAKVDSKDFVLGPVVNGRIRKVTRKSDGAVFIRGCGCKILASKNDYENPKKARMKFSKEQLELKDGTGPCPMGKWNIQK